MFFLPFAGVSQKDSLAEIKNAADTLYTISGFKVYTGQELQIGVGTMPDADFKFIRISSTSLLHHGSMNGFNGLENKANSLPRNTSGQKLKVLRFDKRGDSKHGYVYYPILNYYTRYEVDIDNAINSAEIVVPEEFRPKQKPLVVEMNQNISVADELIKLKKLMDEGVITNEEFQSQKKKLLDQ